MQFGVYDAAANLTSSVFQKLGMIPGKYTVSVCQKLNQKRLYASRYKTLDSTKKPRKIRRGKAKGHDDKNEEKEGESYEAGAF